MATAAFVRAEGVLLDRPAVACAAWLAANALQPGERALRLGGVALAVPLWLTGDAASGLRLAWSALRGITVDRLEVLGEEYWEVHLRPRLSRLGLDLCERARAAGHRVVVVTDLPEPVARHVGAHLRADALVCNRAEHRGDRLTGRLLDPLASAFGGAALRALAETNGYDLATSAAYGAVAGDAVLLSGIGLPCVVAPDRGLRRMARDLDWPVVEP
jgi:phosphoserine phosphatase